MFGKVNLKNFQKFKILKKLPVIGVMAVTSCGGEKPITPQQLFQKKCGTCHSIKPGIHKIGPSLFNVIGRQAGSTDFTEYKALKGADFVWDKEKIAEWITDPKRYMGKPTAMTVKVKTEKNRNVLIEFLARNGK